LRPEAVAELPATGVSALAPPRRRVAPVAMAMAGAAALVIATMAWWFWPATRSPSMPAAAVGTASESAQTAPSVTEPAVAPRLSIVVLPFANLGNDPEQQYFADGITEDLTTDLSRISHMLVISRNTAFTYKDKPVNAKQIGRELGVRYVLEGSVRRSGNQVRVTAQLIDAPTDAHIWAQRFDRDMGDPVRPAERYHAPDSDRTQFRAGCCGSRPADRASRRTGLHSSRTRRIKQGSYA